MSCTGRKKIPVAVYHESNDQVGQSFAFFVKEAIRRSQSFFLVDHESLPKSPRVVVYQVTIEALAGEKAVSSAISVTIVCDSLQTPASGAYIISSVVICGRERLEACAKNTLL
jgi:hypothetical protein